MELSLKPANKLTYKFRLTPQMHLSINLLQMPLVKLKEFVEKQVEENPLLNLENVKPPKETSYDFASEEDRDYKESLIASIFSAISWPLFVSVRSFSLPVFSKLIRPDFSIS